MSEFETNIDKAIKRLLEIEDIEELNVTGAIDGGAGPPKTPNAFKDSDGTDPDDEPDHDSINTNSYTKKPIKHLNMENELFKQMEEMINLTEASYRTYKNDDSQSTKEKLNNSIKQINTKLFEIERICNQNLKLKTKTNSTNDSYWKSTRTRMQKIDERIGKVSNLMKRFYA